MSLFPILFLLFLVFPEGGGEKNSAFRSQLYIVNHSDQRILQLLRKYNKQYFCYTDFIHWVFHDFEGVRYGSGGAGCPADKTLINVTEMNCVTFVENVLAMTMTLQYLGENQILYISDEDLFQIFVKHLNFIRYYTDQPTNYWEDRIHYHTDQLRKLAYYGYLFDLGRINGVPYNKEINYLSRNRSKFPGFRLWNQIQKIEKELTAYPKYYYPLDMLHCYEEIAKDGDIVALTTDIEGLEVSHTGFITVKDGVLYFTHASLKKRKVVVEEPFRTYLSTRTSITGIMAFRPLFHDIPF